MQAGSEEGGKALLEQARVDGFTAVSLSVQREHPAVALYERFGFEREGYRKRHYRRAHGEYVDAILMAYEVK